MEITCPACEKRRQTSAARAKSRTGICRSCFLASSATITVTCSNCRESRKVRPTKQCRYPTGLCRKCYDGLRIAQRQPVTCPKCGKVRLKRKSELSHYQSGRCNGCKFDYDPKIPDTYDAGYVVGAVLGDGYLQARNQKRSIPQGYSTMYAVRLDVKSEAFARRFANALASCSDHSAWVGECDRVYKANPAIGMRAGVTHRYRVIFSDREWFEKLVPIKKEKKFHLLAAFGVNFTAGFIQGFLDAEGYVNSHYVDFANKDLKLLEGVERCLWKLGYRKTRINGPYTRGVYHLRLNGSNLQKTK